MKLGWGARCRALVEGCAGSSRSPSVQRRATAASAAAPGSNRRRPAWEAAPRLAERSNRGARRGRALRGRRAFPFGLRRDGPCDRAGLEGVRPEPEVQAALLEPDVLSPHQAGRELVLAGVLVAPEIPKEPPDPAAGLAAAEVRQRRGAHGLGVVVVSQPARMAHG